MCTKDGATPAFLAAQNGHVAALEFLLDHGASHATCMINGWSPLFFAAHQGHADVVRLLLARGADANAATTIDFVGVAAGSTALSVALAKGHTEVTALLRAL